MSGIDYSLADEIAGIFRDEAAPLIAAAFHADAYTVYDVQEVSDGYGGVTTERVEVESGRCALNRSVTQGGERVAGTIALTDSDYTAELTNPESVLTTNHLIVINGREFDVKDVQRDGNAGMFTYAALNERGPR